MSDVRACVECGSPDFYARERCQRCYVRFRRALRKQGQFVPLIVYGVPLERLLADAVVTPQGCILFAGTLSPQGYGSISIDGHRKQAHRAMYELTVGPIPEGLFLDHVCHNRDLACSGGSTCLHRRCINVQHLEPATNADNTRRGRGGLNNAAKTHCPSGHPYDSENTHWYDGRRYCKACNRIVKARQKRRAS